jgi:hypothetical protein
MDVAAHGRQVGLLRQLDQPLRAVAVSVKIA